MIATNGSRIVKQAFALKSKNNHIDIVKTNAVWQVVGENKPPSFHSKYANMHVSYIIRCVSVLSEHHDFHVAATDEFMFI